MTTTTLRDELRDGTLKLDAMVSEPPRFRFRFRADGQEYGLSKITSVGPNEFVIEQGRRKDGRPLARHDRSILDMTVHQKLGEYGPVMVQAVITEYVGVDQGEVVARVVAEAVGFTIDAVPDHDYRIDRVHFKIVEE